MMVARVWKRARLQPQRIERYMLSDDPEFETKAADVIGLYGKSGEILPRLVRMLDEPGK